MEQIKLEQEIVQDEKAVYPIPVPDCDIRIYLNGYLVKTTYLIEEDPTKFLHRIKLDKGEPVKELEISIVIEKGDLQKEVRVCGLIRELLITHWDNKR